MPNQKGKLLSEKEMLDIRLKMSHAERFRAFMRLIRLKHKLKKVKLKP